MVHPMRRFINVWIQYNTIQYNYLVSWYAIICLVCMFWYANVIYSIQWRSHARAIMGTARVGFNSARVVQAEFFLSLSFSVCLCLSFLSLSISLSPSLTVSVCPCLYDLYPSLSICLFSVSGLSLIAISEPPATHSVILSNFKIFVGNASIMFHIPTMRCLDFAQLCL